MATTALLVIDIQRAAFDGVRCPPIDRPVELVDSAVALIAAARAAGRPVIFVRHCEGAGEPFEDGTPHGELHERLAPLPTDIVIEKRASSAFEKTALNATLQRLGVTDVVVCGLQSEFCVSNTSKSALTLGYGVTVARDGHGTWPSDGQTSAAISAQVNDALAGLGARLATTADLSDALRAH